MNKNNKNNSNQKNQDQNKGNKAPNVNPTGKQDVSNDQLIKGRAGGSPSQKSGSRGSADVQDGGTDFGSSAGSH
ncbi:hypothetical protein WG947_00655 [Pontibacter sp. H259]|uniref:hypothetical protein n=1 Tax=Pontibacter sp. H259 TaxID=3133421 RepID=UPI0030C62F7A